MLRALHRWIWRDPGRRAHKLLRFAEVEADGGRDLVRAAELTRDPRLRGLYLSHAKDEQHHAALFRDRGIRLLRETLVRPAAPFQADWLAPGERGLDDLRVGPDRDDRLLAFLHLSEKAAATAFGHYRDAMPDDPATRAVFTKILRDETFHMTYTREQLSRIAPERQAKLIWQARLGRLWKGYLRLATALAGAIGSIMLIVIYFIVIPPFAWVAKRAARQEPEGWVQIDPRRDPSLKRQF